ncbi:MAG: hypothetical protein KBB54_03380 [Candidatus Pacebacteria bacterium]|nr:hypothetical protein [Candidatus Paceibacterota bacterium]MBP9818496.1 hypothetical protein [Candidatus Paceibacterota bacterium]
MCDIVRCRCGREPEKDTNTCGAKFSLSCKCGRNQVVLFARSDDPQRVCDNWRSLVQQLPYLHGLPRDLSDVPDEQVLLSWPARSGMEDYYSEVGGSGAC